MFILIQNINMQENLNIQITHYDKSKDDYPDYEYGSVVNINDAYLDECQTDIEIILKIILEYLGFDVTIESHYK
jgi:hypothetical protein